MTPILFSATATDFSTNGLGRLSDAVSCEVHEARNGEFELTMEYPVDGAHYSDIVHSAIIVAQPSARRTNQAFRISKITKPMLGTVTVYAQHISYQLSYIPVQPFTATSLTNALSYFTTMAAESCPFTISANFTSSADFAVPLPSSIRSYMGGRKGSILDIYGGEWLFNNYWARLMSARGEDNGYTIRYGKNLTDLTQEENIAETYTGIYPYWTGDAGTVTLTEKVLHADTASNFPFQRTIPLDCSAAFQTQPTEAELREYATSYIADNDIGVPAVSLQIDFVNLPDTEEYKDLLAGVSNIDLCDTVTVQFEKLGISKTAKVVDIRWNVLAERYNAIEVGDSRSTLSKTLEQTIETANAAVTSSQLAGASRDVTDNLTEVFDKATGVLNAGTRGHVILNRNSGGWANELLALDNDNIASAQQVLRINQNGIGFSSDGYDGPYYQAWTMDGTLSLGGTNNAYGNLVILNGSGQVIGYWNKDGISISSGSISIGNKFSVDSAGNMTATDGTFSGDITSGATITGATIYGSQIGTTEDEFYVVPTGEENEVEVGFSGFDVWDKILHTDWMGDVENEATGDETAGINGKNGQAGFKKLYLLDDWYEGRDGSMWDVTRTLKWLDNRLEDIEAFCRQHDWDGGDDDNDPGTTDDDDDWSGGDGPVN